MFVSTVVQAGDPVRNWSTLAEFQACKFEVEDALGERHEVTKVRSSNRG